MFVLDQVEAQRGVHGALDARDADLAIALRRVRITAGEERAVVLHRQVKDRALRDVAGVHVAAERSRRHDHGLLGTGRADAHRAEEGLYRDDDVVLEERVVAVGQVEDLEVGVREILRQQPEAGYNGGPAPAPVWISRTSTARTSPGSASAIATGPASG